MYYMHMGEQAVLDGVKKYGPSAGGKAMMDFEYKHAQEAIESGLYVTYWCTAKQMECARIGSTSLCFCGHDYADHEIVVTKKGQTSRCTKCNCKCFKYVPRRPEECGMWWLPRRKGFKVSEWKAKCKCGKPHTDHKPNPPYMLKPGKGSCTGFYSDFACISCDCRWEDHEVLYEFEHERLMAGKKVGEDYLPLSQNKELHTLVFKTDRNKLPNYNRPRPKKKKAIRGGRGGRGGREAIRAGRIAMRGGKAAGRGGRGAGRIPAIEAGPRGGRKASRRGSRKGSVRAGSRRGSRKESVRGSRRDSRKASSTRGSMRGSGRGSMRGSRRGSGRGSRGGASTRGGYGGGMRSRALALESEAMEYGDIRMGMRGSMKGGRSEEDSQSRFSGFGKKLEPISHYSENIEDDNGYGMEPGLPRGGGFGGRPGRDSHQRFEDEDDDSDEQEEFGFRNHPRTVYEPKKGSKTKKSTYRRKF